MITWQPLQKLFLFDPPREIQSPLVELQKQRYMLKDSCPFMAALPSKLEAIASRLEAIALRLEAIAIRLEAIASRLDAIAII